MLSVHLVKPFNCQMDARKDLCWKIFSEEWKEQNEKQASCDLRKRNFTFIVCFQNKVPQRFYGCFGIKTFDRMIHFSFGKWFMFLFSCSPRFMREGPMWSSLWLVSCWRNQPIRSSLSWTQWRVPWTRLMSSTASQGESQCITVSGCVHVSQPHSMCTTQIVCSRNRTQAVFQAQISRVISPSFLLSTPCDFYCPFTTLSFLHSSTILDLLSPLYLSLCFSVIYLPRWVHGCLTSATKTLSLTTPLTTESVPGRLWGPLTLLQVTNTNTFAYIPTHHSTSSELPVSHPSCTTASTFSLGTSLWVSRNQTLTATQQIFNPTVHQHTHISIVKPLNRSPAHVWCSFPIADTAAQINRWRNVGTEFREVKCTKRNGGGGKQGRDRWEMKGWLGKQRSESSS